VSIGVSQQVIVQGYDDSRVGLNTILNFISTYGKGAGPASVDFVQV